MDPVTAKIIAKVVISQLTDEEKRERLILGIIVAIVICIVIILLPILLLTDTLSNIKSLFGFGDEDITQNSEYESIIEIRNEYGESLESGELVFNGKLPMPVNNAVVTCEFGSRIHPITYKKDFHTGIDLAGAWRSNIMSVLDGKVVWAGVQTGYGNCIEIEHQVDNETFYTFYAHLAKIEVLEGQEVKQGNVIALQGGDPNRDANPGYSTGTHLHFEIRKSKSGDYQNPRQYLFEN